MIEIVSVVFKLLADLCVTWSRLKEPFNYDGKNPSLVEQKTLRDLGHPEGLPNWKITAPRERIIPDRVDVSLLSRFLRIR